MKIERGPGRILRKTKIEGRIGDGVRHAKVCGVGCCGSFDGMTVVGRSVGIGS